MWYHSSDSLVEDSGGGAEMEGTATGRIESSYLAQIGRILDCKNNGGSILNAEHEIRGQCQPFTWPAGPVDEMDMTHVLRGRTLQRC